MGIFVAVAVIFSLLLLNEIWWKHTTVHSEFTRKLVHITVGSFVAFFPYFMTSNEIKLVSGAFLLSVIASRYFNIFKAIHSVQRPTQGEFWFALTVLLLAMLPFDSHIFTVSLLVMSLADGLAAVIGSHFGKKNQYKIFGSTKSVTGTLTFFIVSCILLTGYSYLTKGPTVTMWFIGISFVATALENISYRGLDNFTVPMAVAGLLYLL